MIQLQVFLNAPVSMVTLYKPILKLLPGLGNVAETLGYCILCAYYVQD